MVNSFATINSPVTPAALPSMIVGEDPVSKVTEQAQQPYVDIYDDCSVEYFGIVLYGESMADLMDSIDNERGASDEAEEVTPPAKVRRTARR